MLTHPYFCKIVVKHELSRQISKNTQASNFIKIRPVGAELFYPNGQTDITKLIIAFRFCQRA